MNQIELKRIAEEMGATPIREDDETLFREYVGKYRKDNNIDFKDSWAYVVQASRNLPYKIEEDDELIILGAKKDNSAIVIPNYFIRNSSTLREIGRKVNDSGLSLILKNVGPKKTKFLGNFGFDQYEVNENWDEYSKFDDQSHPQRIVEIESLMGLAGKEYSELRREINRLRDGISDYNISEFLEPLDKLRVNELVNNRDLQSPGFADAHEPFFQLAKLNFRHPMKSFVFEINGKIEGMTISDKISNDCIAYNALIHNPEIPYLSSLLAFETARHAQLLGYKYFNFQGSETESLDQWKRKFNPQHSIKKTHLIMRSSK